MKSLSIIIISLLFTFTLSLEARDCLATCAEKQLGKPYKFGAAGPSSFDCSGLVLYCHKQCGVTSLPSHHGSVIQCKNGKESDCQKGDIICQDSGKIKDGHVMMVVDNGNIISAPAPGKVVHKFKMSSLKHSYHCRRYW